MPHSASHGSGRVKTTILSCGILAASQWALGGAAHHLAHEHIEGILGGAAAAGEKWLEAAEHLAGHIVAHPIIHALFPSDPGKPTVSGLNHDIEHALARAAARSIVILIDDWRGLHSKDRVIGPEIWELDALRAGCTGFLAAESGALPPAVVAEWLDAVAAAEFLEKPEGGAAPWNAPPAGPAPAPPCAFAAWFHWRYPAVFQLQFSEELASDAGAAARRKFHLIVSGRILDYTASHAAQLGAIKAQLDALAGQMQRDDKQWIENLAGRVLADLRNALPEFAAIVVASLDAKYAEVIGNVAEGFAAAEAEAERRHGEDKDEHEKTRQVLFDKLDAVAGGISHGEVNTLHTLPPRPEGFVGREGDLAKLRALNPAAGAVLTGLRGMGGIGKTALALVLAHEWAARFPDAQLFLDARGTQPDPPSAGKLLEQVIHAFHPTAKLPEEEAALAGIYRDVLHGKQVLILLDNAHGAAQAAPLIPPAGCALIVTSRNSFMLGKTAPLNVVQLPDAEAVALLREFHPALTDADAATLVRLCAGLPLALRLAGAHLALDATERGGAPDVAGYVKALGRDRLKHLNAEAADTGEITISETLRLSEAQLPEAERAAWRKLGIFTASFEPRAAQSIAGADDAMLGRFIRRSLLEREGAERYKLHDLAADYARAQLDDPSFTDLHLAHARHYTTVGSEATDLYLKGDAVGGLALFDRERAQIEAAYTWLAGREDEAAARQMLALVNAVVYTGQELRFHPRQRIAWGESQLRAARLVQDRKNEGDALGSLGIAHAALGDTRKAIEFFEQHLAIAREIGDPRGKGNALGNLGVAHADLGDARQAIEFHEQALVVSREIGDRRGEGQDLGNLGLAYAALGDARKAIEFYEQHLAIAREIGDRHGEGNALGNLGLAHADLGDARKAIEFHELALVVSREIGDRRGEGCDLGNLGTAHAALGDARKAIEFHELALVVSREIGDRRGEGCDLGNLGTAHAALGDARQAIKYHEQSLVVSREIGDRRGEGNALGNLGLAHAALGEARQAIEFYEQRLVIAREIGDRRGEGNALGNLGLAHAALGDARQAIEFYEQRLVIAREIGDRRGEGNALWNSAAEFWKMRNCPEAIARAAAALAIYVAIESPNAAMVRTELAEWRAE